MPVPTPASVKKTLDEKRAKEIIPQVKVSSKPVSKTPRIKSTTSSTKKSVTRSKKIRSDISSESPKTSSKSRAISENTDRSPRKTKGESRKSFERKPLSDRPFSNNQALMALHAKMKESN